MHERDKLNLHESKILNEKKIRNRESAILSKYFIFEKRSTKIMFYVQSRKI